MSGRENLLDLLTSRATEGLPEERARQLDESLHELTDIGAEDLDLAAAAVDLAYGSAAALDEPMPEHLKERILQQARAAARGASVAPFRPSRRRKPGPLDARYLGWYAAAAILVLALWAPWSTRPRPDASTPAEQRALLIDSAADVIQVAWARPEIEAYAAVEGDVVWSSRLQSGFMRLRGLPANRREVQQYQLWIVDPTRDERPIDGGVFDIPPGQEEVVVPIDAKLRAENPTAFAITLEQPGGVVVSDGPLLVVAAVGA